MEHTLVFNFYATRENFNSKINKLHFICLKMYKNIFDNIIICINIDDIYDTFFIRKIQNKFLNVFYKEGDINPDITFKIRQNDEYKESLFFYEEIVNKLNEHDMVFFAYNKDLYTDEEHKENLYHWIVSMYYHNLKNIKKVTDSLYYKYFVSYGVFLIKTHTQFTDEIDNDKPFMYYSGAFQWLNCKKIYNIIKRTGIEIPKLDSKSYCELFMGSILMNRMTEVNNCFLPLENDIQMLTYCKEYCNALNYMTEGYLFDFNKIMEKLEND